MVFISVIIPIYKGNKYLNNLLECLDLNSKNFSKYGECEVILINDFPEEKISFKRKKWKMKIKILANSKNEGIHKTRVNGLRNAKGDYIIFLDQDDLISAEMFIKQYEKIKNADVIVSNGIIEKENSKKIIYRNEYSKYVIKNKWAYLGNGSQIISPGQCLIRRRSIPRYWCKNYLMVNGADDFYLWLLMIINKADFVYNNDVLYIHKNTGVNLSDDSYKMIKSEKNVLNIIKDNHVLSRIQYGVFARRLSFKMEYLKANKLNKWVCFFKYIDAFVIFSLFKLIKTI